MLGRNVTASVARLLAVACFVALLAAPVAARAQVVVVANGSPITELDIEHRMRLLATMGRNKPTRQEVINELIDDRIKIAKAKTYGLEVGDSEINSAFANMAQRQGITPAQFSQFLDRAGITGGAVKERIRAELTWQQLIRGKFASSLQVGETDISQALRARGQDDKDAVGYVYTLYPVMIVVPSGSNEAVIEAKRREADNLRSRFVTCNEGLALARSVRDVAVREPVTRSSSDLPEAMRALLDKMEIGQLTTPDVTPQGLQMFALCDRKKSVTDSPAKQEVRNQLFAKRYDAEFEAVS